MTFIECVSNEELCTRPMWLDEKATTAFKDDLVPVRKTDNLEKEGKSFLNKVLMEKEKKWKEVRESWRLPEQKVKS